jgi:MFS family permease
VKGIISRTGSEIRRTAAGLWSEGRGWILVTVAAGWALSIGIRFVYPTLVPFFQDEFQIGFASTGLLMAVLWGGYAVGHIPGGILGDRIGEGNILLVSTAISATTILIVATAVDKWVLFTGTLAIGLATALYGPTRFTIFTNLYSEWAGSAIGITMSAGSVGNALLPVGAAFIASYTSWRLGFGVFIPLFVVVTAAIWLTVPGRTSAPESVVDELSVRSGKRILREITRPSIVDIVLVQISISFAMQGFSAFYPAYLATEKGIAPEIAAVLFGLFFAIGAFVQPVAGALMDRIGTRWTLIGNLGISVTGLWLLPFLSGLPLLGVVTMLVACLNGCFVVTQTDLADLLPEEMRGTGLGTLKAGWMLLGATAPLCIGFLADAGYFDIGFFVLAGVVSVGLSVAVFRL